MFYLFIQRGTNTPGFGREPILGICFGNLRSCGETKCGNCLELYEIKFVFSIYIKWLYVNFLF